ncbi:MAG: glycosyltransferase [Myxococcota bacterium]
MARWQVVHIITHLELGGAQLATLTQLSGTRFFHGKRTLLTGGGPLLERARALEGVEVMTLDTLQRSPHPLKDATALAALTRTLESMKGEPMVVHTHSPKAGVLGRIAAQRAGVERVIHSFHGFGHGHGRFGRAFEWAERLCARLADGYTTDSAANKRQGIEERLFGNRPVEVVHCGVNVESYRFDPVAGETLRQTLNLADRTPLVITLANFKAQKDPLTWVRVVERVTRVRPDTVFAYAGDGPMRGEVEALIDKLDVRRHVRLLGWRTDVRELLSASDLFLLTSRWEGLPQSFGQAMAAGLPIVATRVDGAPEAIRHGETGFLSEPGDVAGLAQSVLRLAHDPTLRDRMGHQARTHVGPLSEEQMLKTLDRFYAQITGEAAPLPATR